LGTTEAEERENPPSASIFCHLLLVRHIGEASEIARTENSTPIT